MTEKLSIRRLLWAGPLTAIIAGAVNLLFYLLTRLAGEKYMVSLARPSAPLEPLPILSILVPTLASALGATLVLAVLFRVTHVPLPPFLSICAAALIVSFGGPFSLTGGTSLATKLLLCVMNILAAVSIVGGLLFFTYKR